jgi:hypothetical protein
MVARIGWQQISGAGNVTEEQRREQFGKFVAALRRYGAIGPAAESVGMGRQTVIDWMDRYEWARDMYQNALELCTDVVESTVYQRAQGDGRDAQAASQLWLRARRPQVWRPDAGSDPAATAVLGAMQAFAQLLGSQQPADRLNPGNVVEGQVVEGS